MRAARVEMPLWKPLVVMLFVAAALIASPIAAMGLELFRYRNSTNSVDSWRVEGLATLIKGSVFTDYLLCNTTSNDGSAIRWMREQGTMSFSLIQTPTTSGKLLLVSNFNTSDVGNYVCFDSLTNESLTINLTYANPAIQAVSDVVTIEAGSSAQLKVYVSGVPDPVSTGITWQKNGSELIWMGEPSFNFSSDHRTLFLRNITSSNIYKCIVTQSIVPYPTAIININVKVLFQAIFIQHPSNLSLVQSSNATLSCSASGSSAPNITWIRIGGSGLPSTATVVTIPNSSTVCDITYHLYDIATRTIVSFHYNYTHMCTLPIPQTAISTLSIVAVQPQDAAQYQCQATVPGTTPVRSQVATIEILNQATVSGAMSTPATTIVVNTNTATYTTQTVTTISTASSPLNGMSLIIIGVCVGVFLLLVATVTITATIYCRRRQHRTKSAISSKNGLQDAGNLHSDGDSSMEHNPNYNMAWLKGNGTSTDDAVVVGNLDVMSSPPMSASDIFTPNLYTSEKSDTPHDHVYSVAVPPDKDSTYSRLQRHSTIIPHDTNYHQNSITSSPSPPFPPPLPPPPQVERIPMRRMGSAEASIASGPLDANEQSVSLNPSTISAMSSAPTVPLDLMSPSNLYKSKSASLPRRISVPSPRDKVGPSVPMEGSLQSIPENSATVTYATPVPRPPEAAYASTLHPTPYLTPSMSSILSERSHVTMVPSVAPATVTHHEEPSHYPPGISSQPWYTDDSDSNAAPSTLGQTNARSREIQPYATIRNSAIPLMEPSKAKRMSKQSSDQLAPSTVQGAPFAATAVSLV